MNARLLAFPLCAAAVLTLDACDGVKATDPQVAVCHDDTTHYAFRRADGSVLTVDVIVHDPRLCRKAA